MGGHHKFDRVCAQRGHPASPPVGVTCLSFPGPTEEDGSEGRPQTTGPGAAQFGFREWGAQAGGPREALTAQRPLVSTARPGRASWRRRTHGMATACQDKEGRGPSAEDTGLFMRPAVLSPCPGRLHAQQILGQIITRPPLRTTAATVFPKSCHADLVS